VSHRIVCALVLLFLVALSTINFESFAISEISFSYDSKNYPPDFVIEKFQTTDFNEFVDNITTIFTNTFSQFDPGSNFVYVLSQPISLFIAIPFAGYIFFRSEIEKLEYLQIRRIFCYGVMLLLVSSAVITPYSYAPYAFATSNSTDITEPTDTTTDSTNSTLDDAYPSVSTANETSTTTLKLDEAYTAVETITSPNSTDTTELNVTSTATEPVLDVSMENVTILEAGVILENDTTTDTTTEPTDTTVTELNATSTEPIDTELNATSTEPIDTELNATSTEPIDTELNATSTE